MYEEDPGQRFDVFLDWCVDCVGSRKENAKGNFTLAGCTIDEIGSKEICKSNY